MQKVVCKLVGEDGNAFAILGRFRNAAKKAGWTKEQIERVTKDAMSGDYNHLLCVISENCVDEEDEEDDYEDDDDDEYTP